MLDKVLESCKYVVDNAEAVKINYDNISPLIDELLAFDNVHYLKKVPYDVYDMETRDIINLLLVYDAIDFSFWGEPKWTIDANGKYLDGGIALLHCMFNLFNGKSSIDVYKELENMTLDEFKNVLKGNVEIPLLEERYNIVISIVKKVNKEMNGDFYSFIKDMNKDIDIFNFILNNFDCFIDKRSYNNVDVYFYKLAQLLTSDILHVIQDKEGIDVNYSNLLGCADYKIPQVMNGFGILEYSDNLNELLESKIEIELNSKYEVEIRASMIVVIDYIWNRIDKKIDRIDINDFIWSKGQDKSKKYRPYHLTRTTSY